MLFSKQLTAEAAGRVTHPDIHIVAGSEPASCSRAGRRGRGIVSELQMHLLSHAVTGRAPAQPPPQVP